MNWGVLWYIDFADWSVISPYTKVIQTCVNFLVGTRSFTLYVLVQFYGKSEFCENGGFSLSGSHISVKSQVAMVSTNIYHSHVACFFTSGLRLLDFDYSISRKSDDHKVSGML